MDEETRFAGRGESEKLNYDQFISQEEYSEIIANLASAQDKLEALRENDVRHERLIAEIQQTLTQTLLEVAKMATTQKSTVLDLVSMVIENSGNISDLMKWRSTISGKHKLDTRTEKVENYTKMLLLVLTEKFNLEELNSLMFDMGVPPEHIKGEEVPTRAQQFVAYMIRRDRLRDLMIEIKKRRPKSLVPEVTGDDYA